MLWKTADTSIINFILRCHSINFSVCLCVISDLKPLICEFISHPYLCSYCCVLLKDISALLQSFIAVMSIKLIDFYTNRHPTNRHPQPLVLDAHFYLTCSSHIQVNFCAQLYICTVGSYASLSICLVVRNIATIQKIRKDL